MAVEAVGRRLRALRVWWGRAAARWVLVVYTALSLVSYMLDQFASERVVADTRLGEILPQWTFWQWLTVTLGLLLVAMLEGAYREQSDTEARVKALGLQVADLAAQLQGIRERKPEYEITALGARSVPHGRLGDFLAEFHIRNDGAKGRFAVTIAAIEGVTEPYVGHSTPVQIGGRPGELSDVFTPGDDWRIGAAIFYPMGEGAKRSIVVWPIDPDGNKRTDLVTPVGDAQEVTIVIRVALVSDMATAYDTRVGMRIVWLPGAKDPHVRPMFDIPADA